MQSRTELWSFLPQYIVDASFTQVQKKSRQTNDREIDQYNPFLNEINDNLTTDFREICPNRNSLYTNSKLAQDVKLVLQHFQWISHHPNIELVFNASEMVFCSKNVFNIQP